MCVHLKTLESLEQQEKVCLERAAVQYKEAKTCYLAGDKTSMKHLLLLKKKKSKINETSFFIYNYDHMDQFKTCVLSLVMQVLNIG